MVLFIMLYKVVLTFECVGVTIGMKAVEQFFPVARTVYYAYKLVLKLLNLWMISVVMQMQFISL